jgi:hypothetical protein
MKKVVVKVAVKPTAKKPLAAKKPIVSKVKAKAR